MNVIPFAKVMMGDIFKPAAIKGDGYSSHNQFLRINDNEIVVTSTGKVLNKLNDNLEVIVIGRFDIERKPLEETLVEALKQAKIAGESETTDFGEDGGTCNHDCPAFRIEGMSKKKIEELGKQADVSITSNRWLGKTWFFLHLNWKGQANRRSRRSETAMKVLWQYLDHYPGVHVMEYCQAD